MEVCVLVCPVFAVALSLSTGGAVQSLFPAAKTYFTEIFSLYISLYFSLALIIRLQPCQGIGFKDSTV